MRIKHENPAGYEMDWFHPGETQSFEKWEYPEYIEFQNAIRDVLKKPIKDGCYKDVIDWGALCPDGNIKRLTTDFIAQCFFVRNHKMNVSIYSCKAIEKQIANGFPANTAAISFYDPKDSKGYGNCTPVDYHKQCERIFYVCIHDIDFEILGDYGLSYDTYFPEASDLADFIIQAEKDGLDIICQCKYGQSRSAACAAAILEYFYHNGISIFADYRYYPNQMVFHKVLDALKNFSAEEIGILGQEGSCFSSAHIDRHRQNNRVSQL